LTRDSARSRKVLFPCPDSWREVLPVYVNRSAFYVNAQTSVTRTVTNEAGISLIAKELIICLGNSAGNPPGAVAHGWPLSAGGTATSRDWFSANSVLRSLSTRSSRRFCGLCVKALNHRGHGGTTGRDWTWSGPKNTGIFAAGAEPKNLCYRGAALESAVRRSDTAATAVRFFSRVPCGSGSGPLSNPLAGWPFR
jgi:hypothetical protein